MAGEQMRFQQHLKNVQCFGFMNVSWLLTSGERMICPSKLITNRIY